MLDTITNDDKNEEKKYCVKKNIQNSWLFFYVSIIIIMNLHYKQQIPW